MKEIKIFLFVAVLLVSMLRRDTRTPAQKAGRSAGQRKRRQTRARKEQLRAANLWYISVKNKIVKKSNFDSVGTYAIYKEDGEWHLMALAVERSTEKMVSDRQGATKSEVRDRVIVVPQAGRSQINPKEGLELDTFDLKKDALKSISAEKSTKLGKGKYLITPKDSPQNVKTYKVDRDKYREFIHSRSVRSMKHKY